MPLTGLHLIFLAAAACNPVGAFGSDLLLTWLQNVANYELPRGRSFTSPVSLSADVFMFAHITTRELPVLLLLWLA